MNFCPKCGVKIDDPTASFCKNCGTKISDDKPEQNSSSNFSLPPNIDSQIQPQNSAQSAEGSFHALDENFQDLFVKREGRLNRLRYFKRNILVGVLVGIPNILLAVILEEMSLSSTLIKTLDGVVDMIFSIVFIYLTYGLVVRRSHDLPKNNIFAKYLRKDDEILAKAFAIFLILQQVGLIIVENAAYSLNSLKILKVLAIPYGLLGLFLLFAKGESGSNEFGPDPLGYTVNKNDPRAYRPQNSQKKTFLT